MNKERRNKIEELGEHLSTISGAIAGLAEAEREAFEALPESLQGSERGQQMDGNAEILENAVDSLDEISDALREII